MLGVVAFVVRNTVLTLQVGACYKHKHQLMIPAWCVESAAPGEKSKQHARACMTLRVCTELAILLCAENRVGRGVRSVWCVP